MMPGRTLAAAFVLTASLMAVAPVSALAADAALKAAVDSPKRAEANRARDAHRRPAESLAFWGVRPNSTVIEISPGGGYWTEILAPYAATAGGTYVAGVADLADPRLSEGARKGRESFAQKFAVFGPIAYADFGPRSAPLGAPCSADVVITARNIHNWLMGSEPWLDKAMADFYAVLKPGGTLGVEEHRADPLPEAQGFASGYVSTATVIAAAEKAGFKLAASSELNANPKDTKDHPFGVWTLPPSRNSAPNGKPADPAFDRAKYDAIGESDRMMLRFVKPA